MIDLLKDRYKLGLGMAVLFFLGVLASVYSIYSLPYKLMLADGYQTILSDVYFTVGVTFVLGTVTIWYALKYKNEVVVYRDKKLDQNAEQREAGDSGLTTISLDSVKTNLKQSKNEKDILDSGLQAICKQLDAGQGAIYLATEKDGQRRIELRSGYALSIGENTVISYSFGEGLVGQCAAGAKTIYINDIPEGYIKIISGLGSAFPRYLLIVPMKDNDRVLGAVEIASFTPINDNQRKFVEESAQLIADSLSATKS